jgi:N-acetylmuramoyl-L-alanine amidase/LysM domain
MIMRSSLVLVLVGLLMGLALGGCHSSPSGARAAPAAAEHFVVAGETLTSIAIDFNVALAVIVDANNLHDHNLHAGQRLLIPGGRLHPVPAASEPQTDAGRPATDWYIARNLWAVDPVILSRTKPMLGTPFRITVHHSGDVKDAGMDPLEWLRLIDRQHMDGLGKKEPWACIGYHFIVAPDGRVFEGRPLQFQGAHAGYDEVNRLNIGVCLIGDFDKMHVPAAQREGLMRALDQLCLDYGISRGNVYGHQHWKVTDCPGRYLMAIVDGYAGEAHAPAGSTRLGTLVASP